MGEDSNENDDSDDDFSDSESELYSDSDDVSDTCYSEDSFDSE